MKAVSINKFRGVTLIELIIVIVIIAIIAAVAFPSYAQYVRKSKRVKAQSCLMEYVQYMERFRSANMRYDQKSNGDAHVLPTLDCATDGGLDTDYTISLVSGSLASRTYTLQAVPQGSQVADPCQTMTINQLSAKTASQSSCW